MNYSFRKKNKIVKYIVLHYTGMKSLALAYQKLSSESSNVSAHYLISRDGTIFNLLCPSYKAWHRGKSKWKNKNNLNDHSIGIEIENKGHEFNYSNFTNSQYLSLKKLVFFLKRDFYIIDENIVFHSDIAPDRKQDPGEKFFIKKIGINRFKKKKKIKVNYNMYELLILYGFHKSYVRKYREQCICAVKRTLNYKKITSLQSKKFLKDFYNLLFH